MCFHVYLLVNAVVSLHVVAVFIFFYIYAHYFVTVQETKCLSYLCTNLGSIGALQWQCSGKLCAVWQPFFVIDVCQICVQCPL